MQPVRLYAEEFGGAPHGASPRTVVLLSSIATTLETWRNQAPALAETHRVIALDHLGHGRSPRSQAAPGETTVDDLAANVLATLDGLGVERFSLVGLSLGGALAQYLAATSPRVERAVFCSTAAFLGGPQRWVERTNIARSEGMAALADDMVANWFTATYRAEHPDIVSWVREMIRGIDAEGFAQNGDALAGWDFASRLGEITCPVLTIAGAGDPSTGPEQLAEIASGVAGPVESVVVTPGSHQLALENPEPCTAALVEFLA
ncbi:alpha/beta fold hydrolase [Corynebacterium liangguodongii]|uniref:Alpha/beta hydrolase n=1 Tax=Corynebacterium liangguodongii TaxID=2079535 RepID=A0A2S0WFI1_9CORY|nr:alpha/beta fold hydrolase [Corynebacterium liangguodongii]AWB84528.1 alpha/beta hydrolase [Corynebacterium liangguodongii]PWB98888.1 alpha/beta hydrolase [Corynebacterium liangguodongii]